MSNSPAIQPKGISAGVVARRIGQQAKGLVFMALWITLLFVCAGHAGWIRGWVCVGIYLVGLTATGIIVHHANHELLERRAKWQHKDTKGFDTIFLAIFFPLTVIQPAMAGLDVVRFHWSAMPSWTILPAAGLFLTAMALVSWTLATNPFAESTVRIQSERGQSVIRSGPYAYIRHPMYVGMILMYLATGWMLGSMAALLVGILMAVLLIVRTALEDRTLRCELPGYADYSQVTRFRSHGETTIYRAPWRDGKLIGPPVPALKLPFAFEQANNGNGYDFSKDLSMVVYTRPGGQADLYYLSRR